MEIKALIKYIIIANASFLVKNIFFGENVLALKNVCISKLKKFKFIKLIVSTFIFQRETAFIHHLKTILVHRTLSVHCPYSTQGTVIPVHRTLSTHCPYSNLGILYPLHRTLSVQYIQ